jgi:hypothetical protein
MATSSTRYPGVCSEDATSYRLDVEPAEWRKLAIDFQRLAIDFQREDDEIEEVEL